MVIKNSFLDYKVHYNSSDSDWVVFIHGIGGNHTIFYKQIDSFKSHFNLLLIDLPGHGGSFDIVGSDDTLSVTSRLIVTLLDELNIRKAHFVGVSLGTVIMQYMSVYEPERFKSMVLGGAVGKLLNWGDVLVRITLSPFVRNVLPYMAPYVLFAHILMPKKKHKKSRNIFVREAHKLGKSSYVRWATVIRDSVDIYRLVEKYTNFIPKLYISGEEDHMFLDGIKAHVEKEAFSQLHLIGNCGHVCNIERHCEFNNVSIQFLKQNSKVKIAI